MNVQKNKKEANYLNKERLQELVEKNKIILLKMIILNKIYGMK